MTGRQILGGLLLLLLALLCSGFYTTLAGNGYK